MNLWIKEVESGLLEFIVTFSYIVTTRLNGGEHI
jgi:hypothetical protein